MLAIEATLCKDLFSLISGRACYPSWDFGMTGRDGLL